MSWDCREGEESGQAPEGSRVVAVEGNGGHREAVDAQPLLRLFDGRARCELAFAGPFALLAGGLYGIQLSSAPAVWLACSLVLALFVAAQIAVEGAVVERFGGDRGQWGPAVAFLWDAEHTGELRAAALDDWGRPSEIPVIPVVFTSATPPAPGGHAIPLRGLRSRIGQRPVKEIIRALEILEKSRVILVLLPAMHGI